MRLLWWKKQEKEETAFAPYEEIEAKRTSKLGYFFLILMVIFGVWQGNDFLQALKEVIKTPEPNSYCLQEMAQLINVPTEENMSAPRDPYYMEYRYDSDGLVGCSVHRSFTVRERALGIDTLYAQVLPKISERSTLENELRTLDIQLQQLQAQRNETRSDYDTSLLENIAKTETNALDAQSLQGQLTAHDVAIQGVQSQINLKKGQSENILQDIKSALLLRAGDIKKAYAQYRHELIVVEFERFLLSIVFILPVFLLVWQRYHRARERRSEYTIIWGGMVAVASLILAQVLLVFVYEILPHAIIQKLLMLLASIKLVWAALYWLGFILVPLFFGFLIYLIQKKFYNKRAVMMRAVKSGHCPNCTMHIHHAMNHCPICGYTLKSTCSSCGAKSLDGGAFCEVCGARREQKPPTPPQQV